MKDHRAAQELDLTKPRLASYKQKRKKAPGNGVLGRFVHSSKRRTSITNKRMDPREHKNWARIRSCNGLLAW